MRHPLESISGPARRPFFLVMLIWTLLLFSVFQVLNLPLMTRAAPAGIVSHQLAWTQQRAAAILASWDTRASLLAAFGLGLDFLFMPSYALAVALGTLLSASRHQGWLKTLGAWAAYGMFVGVLFDALENVGQAMQIIFGSVSAPWTAFVGVCATIKFSLLLLGVLYGLASWILPKGH